MHLEYDLGRVNCYVCSTFEFPKEDWSTIDPKYMKTGGAWPAKRYSLHKMASHFSTSSAEQRERGTIGHSSRITVEGHPNGIQNT